MNDITYDLARSEAVRSHPLFVEEMNRIFRMEAGRVFCRHGMDHLMDVARAAWIFALENQYPLKKDIVYTAALLHDIGKGRQYEFGTPHHLASAEIAEQILRDCAFSEAEISDITYAIRLHRKPSADEMPLVQILYAADKKTRLCFSCPVQHDCNWSDEKKNLKIMI